MKTIIINATATKSSGALTILRSFLSYIEKYVYLAEYHFYLFTVLDFFQTTDKVTVIRVEVRSIKKRLAWDNGGLKTYCDINCINPHLIISNQNTCTKWKGVSQLVYFHQALAIIPYNWNIFNKSEIRFWLYRKISFFYKQE